MKAAGIICEFNPFHEGHKYLIDKASEAGAERIVCVMSGDFTQRGFPAVCDKWARAKAAVSCGCDLVIELPTVFCLSSAADFAAKPAADPIRHPITKHWSIWLSNN